MEIISLDFAFFVLAVAALYYLLPGKWQKILLLAASYFYYQTWAWWFVVVLAALTGFNFLFAKVLHQRRSKLLLWSGVGVNSAILLIFLLGGPISNWGKVMGFEIMILLPLGLSYRVLESISYLIDIHLRIAKPTDQLLDFALYLGYFPKLVSGPIERARRFLPHLNEVKTLDNQALARSLLLIGLGLLRLVVIAGMMTVLFPIAGILFEPARYNAQNLIVGLFGYAFMLYNQFAGYTDLMRGISGLLGIQLTNNFAQPFFSKDFSDFWKRWHISLSSWLRDYIYMPMSRALLRRNPSRKNIPNLIFPPLATMLVSGLWHGARLHLLVWGALNGLYIVLENLLNLFRPTTPGKQAPPWQRALGGVVLVGLALAAAVPFRIDLPTSKVFFYQLIYKWQLQIPDLRILFVFAASLLLDWIQYRANDETVFLKWPRWAQAAAAALLIFGVVIVYHLQNAASTFVYP
jgi:D-alanyl-lipoteichoic acid acyltransferase DltB (MBOAT superfamily)